ncbi:MAG: O-acetyl-ADP-ribose deacetylase [Candidatus Aerophobetes bacterium]
MQTKVGNTRLTLTRGDITTQETEVIVNAANSSLLGGGGVDGAIHRAGGPEILEECKRIRAKQSGCPTGEAVITTGGLLKPKYVIHTVGPIWRGGNQGEEKLLANAYRNSLSLAKENGIRSLSFPSISTGAYGYPIQAACRVALSTVRDFLMEHDFEEVRFVLFSDEDLRSYEKAWGEIITSS